MTEVEWDAELVRVTKVLRDSGMTALLECAAVLGVEFIYGPRSTCGNPPPTGLLKSPAKGSTSHRMDTHP